MNTLSGLCAVIGLLYEGAGSTGSKQSSGNGNPVANSCRGVKLSFRSGLKHFVTKTRGLYKCIVALLQSSYRISLASTTVKLVRTLSV